MARNPVDAIKATPPAYGLVAALQNLVSEDPSLMVGAQWVPESCGTSGVQSIACAGDVHARTAAHASGIEQADPFVVWASFTCSPFGMEAIDYQGIADRQLQANQSYEIAKELWTGTLATADNLDNPALTDPTSDTVTTGGATPLDALGCLEQGLAVCGRNARGLIHATPQMLVHWVTNGSVSKQGGQYVSPMGNIVVADGGYDGSGPGGTPAGATQWVYATDLMRLRLGRADAVPPNVDGAIEWASALRRSDNTVAVFAQRPVLIQWDACCHVAAEVALPVCLLGGVS